MEAIGFKKRLKEAKNSSQKLKLIFQYPGTTKAIIKKGGVLSVNEDSFDFQDIYDGELTFGYEFLVEISNWEDKTNG